MPGPRRRSSGTSKAALIHLTRVAAVELAEAGIRVNALCPGPTLTPGFTSLVEGDEWENLVLKNIPACRFGTPEEIADAAYWLASPGNGYVTGIVLPVDGGETAR